MDARDIHRELIDYMHLHHKVIHKIIDEMDLSYGQLPIMEIVKDHNGCSQKVIAEKFNVSKPSITNSIKRLEKKGWIEKKENPDDARYSLIYITEKGAKATNAARERFFKIDEEIFKNISKEERNILYQILLKMNENIKEVQKNV